MGKIRIRNPHVERQRKERLKYKIAQNRIEHYIREWVKAEGKICKILTMNEIVNWVRKRDEAELELAKETVKMERWLREWVDGKIYQDEPTFDRLKYDEEVGAYFPADDSFEAVNQFVNYPGTAFEHLQSMCLSLAAKLEKRDFVEL